MTTYQGPPSSGMVQASWLAALLRDVAIIVAVVVYAIDTL